VAVLTPIDWVVLIVYFVGIVGFGIWIGRDTKGISDFFLAGREMKWWAAGLSVMATQISAITFVGTTGQAYTQGMSFLVVYFGLPIAMVVLSMTLVPFFYRSGVFTAYEYLEKRFDSRTRTLTSLLFLFSRGLSMGVTLYAPSLVLSVILGWSETVTILVMGGTTILYVVHGGNKSVIWTDVVQMIIIWAGIFICAGAALAHLPEGVTLRDSLAVAQITNHLEIMDVSTDPSRSYTVWSGLIGGAFLAMAYFGADQSQVQRYLSAKSLGEARLSLLFSGFLKVPMQFLILLTGVLVFVFYHYQRPPLLWNAQEMRRLETTLPAAELASMQGALASAHAARAAAAAEYSKTRSDASRQAYVTAHQQLGSVQTQAGRRAAELAGAKTYNDTNYIFPSYVLSRLSGGLAGLVMAVIFAAAMSTLAGEFNSVATASMVDFYQRFVRTEASAAHYLWVSRLFTALWGVFACLVALQAGRLGSAIEVVNRFGSYFYGSILGVFALAILTPKASARGAFYGLIAGMATVFLVSRFTSIAFLWYNVVGALTVFLVGLALTAVFPPRQRVVA
jgi:solute:Na+ symporter, SSS family